jgi:hypothetical protein
VYSATAGTLVAFPSLAEIHAPNSRRHLQVVRHRWIAAQHREQRRRLAMLELASRSGSIQLRHPYQVYSSHKSWP